MGLYKPPYQMFLETNLQNITRDIFQTTTNIIDDTYAFSKAVQLQVQGQ